MGWEGGEGREVFQLRARGRRASHYPQAEVYSLDLDVERKSVRGPTYRERSKSIIARIMSFPLVNFP